MLSFNWPPNAERCRLMLCLFIACGQAAVAQAQVNLSNPLVRPSSAVSGSVEPAVQASQVQPTERRAPAFEEASSELVGRAAARLTQEQLLVQQQRLNNPLVPKPLLDLFKGMRLVAHHSGLAVLRKPRGYTSVLGQQVNGQRSNSASAGNFADQVGQTVGTYNVVQLQVDKTTQIQGYTLMASLIGRTLLVSWYDREQDVWANVYRGSLQSGQVNTSRIQHVQLQKRETATFDYLKPSARQQFVGGTQFGSPGAVSDRSVFQPSAGEPAPLF